MKTLLLVLHLALLVAASTLTSGAGCTPATAAETPDGFVTADPCIANPALPACWDGGTDLGTDGTDLGTDLGTDDGTDVGTDDGTDVGTDVGTDDGIDVGTDDDTDVGTDDGTDVGTDDGTDVGTDDGTDVGTDDGADDGTDDVGPDTPDSDTTTAPGEVDAAISSSATYGWSIPASAPAINAACSTPDQGFYGAYVAWKGFVHDGTTYTCNACPGGLEAWQGTWRQMNADSDPTVTNPSDPSYKERLVVDGNTWVMEMESDTGSQRVEGYYWCGQKPEVNNETTAFVATKVSQEGVFGWDTGVLSSLLVLEKGFSEILTFWYFDFETFKTSGFEASVPYCKVGSTVTADGTQHACTDPLLGTE